MISNNRISFSLCKSFHYIANNFDFLLSFLHFHNTLAVGERRVHLLIRKTLFLFLQNFIIKNKPPLDFEGILAIKHLNCDDANCKQHAAREIVCIALQLFDKVFKKILI